MINWKSPFVGMITIPIVVFFYFWGGIYAIPKADQHWFIRQRAYEKSDWSYFKNALSYNRTRSIMRGKFDFLYRPATHGLLALEALFLADHPILLGVFSLLGHIATCLLLYFLLKNYISAAYALGFSLLFAGHNAGSEMFLWHHVNPYLYMLFFFGLGFYVKNKYAVGFCFFAATLFHEAAALTLLVLAAYSFYEKNRERALVYLTPALCYFGLNIINGIMLGAFSSAFNGSEEFSKFSTIEGFFQIFGMAVALLFFPWIESTSLGEPGVEKIEWALPESSFYLYFLFGIAAFATVIYLIRKIEKKEILMGFGVLTLVLLLGFSKGRIGILGPKYILVSTYYFYFTTFVGIVFIALNTKIPQKIFVPILVLTMIGSFVRTQQRIELTYNSEKPIADIVASLGGWLRKNPQYCYSGTLLNKINSMALSSALFHKSCALNKGTPAVFTVDGKGAGFLIQLPDTQKKPVAWPKGENFKPSSVPNIDMGLFSSANNYRVQSLSAKVSNAGVGALVFGIQEKDHFNSIVFGPEKIALIAQKGRAVNAMSPEYTVGNSDNTEIEIRKMGNLTLLLKDRVILGSLPFAFQMDGKVGIFSWNNEKKSPVFSDIQVSETAGDANGLKVLGRL